MARKKQEDSSLSSTVDSSSYQAADVSQAEILKSAFESVLNTQFGFARAPEPYITPFGIQHLDALLGGGIVSSSPVVLSSTPETGYRLAC